MIQEILTAKTYRLECKLCYKTVYKYGSYLSYKDLDIEHLVSLDEVLDYAKNKLLEDENIIDEICDGVSIELYFREVE